VQALRSASDPRDRKDVATTEEMKINESAAHWTSPPPTQASRYRKICGGQWRPARIPVGHDHCGNKFNHRFRSTNAPTTKRMTTPLLTLDVSASGSASAGGAGATLSVATASCWASSGPTCRKTTLFAMISGDVRPDVGEISLAGRPITALAPAARTRAGHRPDYQVPRPFEHMTVFENVLTGPCMGPGWAGAARDTALHVLTYWAVAHGQSAGRR